ncbi:hypothetical protein B0H67DRAFT_642883 [Lasiosphaeris hirsuta]|uniref:Short-chain dehydrogenase n=1 Tax=Lasiosphaeris hirsuta TaxID=260670 RepID=A0AA40APE3_9PEZI|nr:hypothetical protein B0H67DRAFT_642883 [Lasiosphaeris hirsuta]
MDPKLDINSLFGVQGKVVLVTGGAKGLGLMISRGFVLNLQRVFTLTPLLEAAGAASSSAPAVDPGRVIHIGSIDGLRVPLLLTFAYSASKAGLHHLSGHLAAVTLDGGASLMSKI